MPHYIDNLAAPSLCLPSGAEQVVLCGSLKLVGMKAADCRRDESKPKQKFTIVQLLPSISDPPTPFKNNNLLVINVKLFWHSNSRLFFGGPAWWWNLQQLSESFEILFSASPAALLFKIVSAQSSWQMRIYFLITNFNSWGWQEIMQSLIPFTGKISFRFPSGSDKLFTPQTFKDAVRTCTAIFCLNTQS